jgi:hypothetical protein
MIIQCHSERSVRSGGPISELELPVLELLKLAIDCSAWGTREIDYKCFVITDGNGIKISLLLINRSQILS